MGEYFTPIFLNTAGHIVCALDPADYGSGFKLAGHTRADAPLMSAVLTLLALDAAMRLVWAGDYADPEPGHQANLYFLVEDRHFVRFDGLVADGVAPNRPLGQAAASTAGGYLCNLEKGECIAHADLRVDHTGWRRTPLPSLTVESERTTPDSQNFGAWARDRLHYCPSHPGPGWAPRH
ncbi:hypothetical protein [Mycobacterium paragordonae]|jgi:hypothetical protein|uniref:hypothetical protein n=1 Tax=Mycobacterium paragordonae TaxID=1389713 RepID=UPI0012E1B279|nr:hypothetical protein [Mycobacterium paragordonae]